MPLFEHSNEKFGYKDYLTWPDDERWEIIDGVAYDMTPAPNVKHQRIVVNLARFLDEPAKKKACMLFVAPTDVVFDEYNVVQPDVFVVCDRAKITAANIQGAPDLIIEILSPSTRLKDMREKRRLYESFGVMEYILIDPVAELAERFMLRDGEYGAPDVFNWDETMVIGCLEFELILWNVFEKHKEQVL
jgi:Uma2 family endonuclease